jgi:hypothetical protein
MHVQTTTEKRIHDLQLGIDCGATINSNEAAEVAIPAFAKHMRRQ